MKNVITIGIIEFPIYVLAASIYFFEKEKITFFIETIPKLQTRRNKDFKEIEKKIHTH